LNPPSRGTIRGWLKILSVIGFDGQFLEINFFQAPNIHRNFRKGDPLRKRLNSANITEKMADHFFIEQIFSEMLFSREEREVRLVDEIQNKAFLRAMRTIARDDRCEVCLNLITNSSAMATSGIYMH
jgi:hypothetical protein